MADYSGGRMITSEVAAPPPASPESSVCRSLRSGSSKANHHEPDLSQVEVSPTTQSTTSAYPRHLFIMCDILVLRPIFESGKNTKMIEDKQQLVHSNEANRCVCDIISGMMAKIRQKHI
jgi:hypothetical protein